MCICILTVILNICPEWASFFCTWRNLHDIPFLIIIVSSRVVSDSHQLKFHNDHPTRMTGVLQGPLTNYVTVALPSHVLLIEPVLKISWLLNLALEVIIGQPHISVARSASFLRSPRESIFRLWCAAGCSETTPTPDKVQRVLRRVSAIITTGTLQIWWTVDGDKDVAALATMYFAEVPNESSISQRSFHRMF